MCGLHEKTRCTNWLREFMTVTVINLRRCTLPKCHWLRGLWHIELLSALSSNCEGSLRKVQSTIFTYLCRGCRAGILHRGHWILAFSPFGTSWNFSDSSLLSGASCRAAESLKTICEKSQVGFLFSLLFMVVALECLFCFYIRLITRGNKVSQLPGTV